MENDTFPHRQGQAETREATTFSYPLLEMRWDPTMSAGENKTKRRRPTTKLESSVTLSLPTALLEWIDNQAQLNKANRPEMIRRLIEEARLGVPPELSRIRTAYHEAGHAVVARALGIPVTVASIETTDSSLGHVEFAESALQMHWRLCKAGIIAKSRSHLDRAAWCAHIRAIMAGREAEVEVLGFHHDVKSDSQDKRDVKKLAKWLDYKTRDETLRYLRLDTIQLVGNTARSIRRVADALIESSSICQNQIDRIITQMNEKVSPSLLRAYGLKGSL